MTLPRLAHLSALFILLALPVTSMPGAAQDTPVESDLVGTIHYQEMLASGPSVGATSEWNTLRIQARDRPIEGQLAVSAHRIDVHWTRTEDTHYVEAPYRPGTSLLATKGAPQRGSTMFQDAHLHLPSTGSAAALLAIADGPTSTLQLHVSTWLEAKPNQEEAWRAGQLQNGQNATNAPHLMTIQRAVPIGLPTIFADGNLTLTLDGNLTLFAWDTNITISSPARDANYRSGSWRTTNPDLGSANTATWTETAQLLEIRLTNATLSWHQKSANTLLAAPWLNLDTEGAVRYEQADASLQTADAVYASDGSKAIQVNGFIRQNLTQAGQRDRLASHLDRTQASVNVSPNWRNTAAVQAPGPWLFLGAAIAAGGALEGRRLLRKRRLSTMGHLSVNERISHARKALAAGDHARAKPIISALCREHPTHSEAWALHATRLYEDAQYRRLVREIEPRMDEDRPGMEWVAFHLARAHARLGNAAQAAHWLQWAMVDEAVARVARFEPAFQPVVKTNELRRRLGLSDADQSYG